LKNFQLMMTSGVVRFEISGKVEDRVLVVMDERHGAQRVQKICLEELPYAGCEPASPLQEPALFPVGESFDLSLFDPTTLSQKGLLIQGGGKRDADPEQNFL
jgi:hypothetical protein